MNHHLISALILLLALGFYAVGVTTAAGFLFIFGFIFEMWFWVRVTTKAKQTEK